MQALLASWQIHHITHARRCFTLGVRGAPFMSTKTAVLCPNSEFSLRRALRGLSQCFCCCKCPRPEQNPRNKFQSRAHAGLAMSLHLRAAVYHDASKHLRPPALKTPSLPSSCHAEAQTSPCLHDPYDWIAFTSLKWCVSSTPTMTGPFNSTIHLSPSSSIHQCTQGAACADMVVVQSNPALHVTHCTSIRVSNHLHQTLSGLACAGTASVRWQYTGRTHSDLGQLLAGQGGRGSRRQLCRTSICWLLAPALHQP